MTKNVTFRDIRGEKMEQMPKITTIRRWSADSVRRLCIREDYYTRGDVAAYNFMLQTVNDNEPTTRALWVVANDIFQHSVQKHLSVSQIMYQLEDYSVETIFEITEEI